MIPQGHHMRSSILLVICAPVLSAALNASAAETIGSGLVQRPITDGDAGQVYVYSGITQPFKRTGVVTSWSFFDNHNTGRWVTPLLFKINLDGTYGVASIGTSVESTGKGLQTHPFSPIAGLNVATPGRYTIGFTDRIYLLVGGQSVAGAANPGVVPFTGPGVYSDPWQATAFVTTGGPVTLNVGSVVGGPDARFDTNDGGRIYSLQETLSPRLAGDANLDGTVNFPDLLILAQNYGRTSGVDFTTGDFNDDGRVDFSDLLLLSQNYGKTVPAIVAPTPVPEPSGSGFLVIASLVIVTRSRLRMEDAPLMP